MVDAFGRAQPSNFVVFAQERRQLQCLQVVRKKDLRCIGHAATPLSRAMYDRADVVVTVALGR